MVLTKGTSRKFSVIKNMYMVSSIFFSNPPVKCVVYFMRKFDGASISFHTEPVIIFLLLLAKGSGV